MSDTLRRLQEAEREYGGLKQVYHDNLADIHRTERGTPEREGFVTAQKEIHRDLAAAKSRVNALRITLGSENQKQALETLGANGSAAAAMRALTRQVGAQEHVVTVLCQYLDDPEGATWSKVLQAVTRYRKIHGR